MLSKPSTYLPDAEHANVCAALVTLARTLHERTTLDTQDVAFLLGVNLDIFPERVRRDMDATYHREREARRTLVAGLVPPVQVIPDQVRFIVEGER